MESIPAGRTIFRENRLSRRLLLQRDKMYLLLKGRVSLIAGTQELRSVKAGEIFGEMSALANVPRTATAVAKTACRVIALDQRQFKKALAKKPSFALMLMKLMVARLREMVARLKASGGFSGDDAPEESAVFSPGLLADTRGRLRLAFRGITSLDVYSLTIELTSVSYRERVDALSERISNL